MCLSAVTTNRSASISLLPAFTLHQGENKQDSRHRLTKTFSNSDSARVVFGLGDVKNVCRKGKLHVCETEFKCANN